MCFDSDVPAADPRQIEALVNQSNAASKLMDYTIASGERNEALLADLYPLQKNIMQSQYDQANLANQRAADQWNYYLQYGRPMMTQALQDARTWDSEENLSNLRGKAYSDVEQQYATQKDAALRQMQRAGVNPASGRYMEALSSGGADMALAKVQAANSMTENRRLQGVGLRQQAANMANGFPAQSIGMSNLASSQGAGALQAGNASLTGAFGAQGAMTSGMGTAGNMYGGVASGFNSLRQTDIYGQQVGGQGAAGFGNLVGSLGSAFLMRPSEMVNYAMVR